MKVSSAVFSSSHNRKYCEYNDILCYLDELTDSCCGISSEIVVLGSFFGENMISAAKKKGIIFTYTDYISILCHLSLKKNICICSGGVIVVRKKEKFIESFFICGGKVVFSQIQLYTSSFERSLGLSQGSNLEIFEYNGVKCSIIQSTDTLYPNTFRYAAMQGARLILCPTGFYNSYNKYFQFSGAWNNCQMNNLFCIESGFNGNLYQKSIWGESYIHTPLNMLDFGRISDYDLSQDRLFIYADLNFERLSECSSLFDPLEGLNKNLYEKLYFQGEK